MKRYPVPVRSRDELATWPTKRLLGRLRRLRILEEAPERSDMTPEEADRWRGDAIGFKSDEAWAAAYHDLKDILATREHLGRTLCPS